MSQLKAALVVAESIAALLDGMQHVARCGGLKHANGDYLLDCGRRVDIVIYETKESLKNDGN